MLASFGGACRSPSATRPDPSTHAPARFPAAPPPASSEATPGTWTPRPALAAGLERATFAEKNAATNLSDAAVLVFGARRYLVVVADEGHEFALVDLAAPERAKLFSLGDLPRARIDVKLPEDREVEVDFEAVVTTPERVLLVASASLKRKKAGKKSDLERLAEVVPASGAGKHFSDFVYELRILADAEFPRFELVAAHNLRELLLGIPLLARFRDIPSKDNGLDVEGAVAHAGFYYFGLRGPVLRGRALVARTRTDFGDPQLVALDLAGLGVRALTSAGRAGEAGALYLLAGPTMSTETEYRLYRWTGDIDAANYPRVAPVLVGSVPSSEVLTPEGLFVSEGELCTLHDGVRGGAPACRPLASFGARGG